MAAKEAPQPPLTFPDTPSKLLQTIKEAISASRKAQDQVAQVRLEDATFENVLGPLALAQAEFSNTSLAGRFLKSASADPDLRDAARAAEKVVDDFIIETWMREDVFRAVDAVYKRSNLDSLDAESQYLLTKIHRAYVQNGLCIKDISSRERYKEIKRRISDLCIECTKNFSSERSGLWLTPDELDGVPEDFLLGLQPGEGDNAGKVFLTLKMPDYTPAMKYAKNGDIRHRIFLAFENKCKANAPLVSEIYILRDEAARLLGYPNHATMRLEDKMAGTTEFVTEFLDDLRTRLTPAAKADIKRNLATKAADLKARGLESQIDGKLYLWDTSYYDTIEKQNDYSFNQNEAAEYFPLQTCLPNMLETFSKLFGMCFLEVTSEVKAWHEDVKVYQVWDDEGEGGGFLGYLYFDLHPRDFKHNHNSHYGLQKGYTKADGTRFYPSSILMCNFTKPLPHKPSLLKHPECTTLFHEIGHAIHNLVSRTRYASFHGTSVSRDFVETPSKMLENWYWLPSQLKAVSHHYAHLKPEYMDAWKKAHPASSVEPPPLRIPAPLLNALISTRYVNFPLAQLRQLFFASYDMAVHTPASHAVALNTNYQTLYNRLRTQLTLLADDGEPYDWGNNHSKFSHLWTGYDAGYYGYPLALAYSADVFERFFAKEPMDAGAGRKWRYEVLQVGGAQPEMLTLEKLLGRRPDSGALMRNMGLDDDGVGGGGEGGKERSHQGQANNSHSQNQNKRINGASL